MAAMKLVLLLFALTITAVRISMMLRKKDELGQRQREMPPDPSDPRWGESEGEQVTGKVCVDCSHKIAMRSEGRFCKQCNAPVHKKTCAKRHKALAHPQGSETPYR